VAVAVPFDLAFEFAQQRRAGGCNGLDVVFFFDDRILSS
jgi:hypothetical protein